MLSIIRNITKQLFPNGRAFWQPKDGVFDRLNKALALSEERAILGALSTFDSAFPDNTNFTTEDADMWEKRMGMINGSGVALVNRMAAIRLKYNYPVTNAPRQYYKYLEEQLRAVGFDVRVYPNKFEVPVETSITFDFNSEMELIVSGDEEEMAFYEFQMIDGQIYVTYLPGAPLRFRIIDGYVYAYKYGTKTPNEWLAPINATMHSTTTRHSNVLQHSTFQYLGAYHSLTLRHRPQLRHGARFNNYVANHIERSRDGDLAITGDKWKSTFYIAGEDMPGFATIPQQREAEFRQMILRLKPVNSIGILFVNYQ